MKPSAKARPAVARETARCPSCEIRKRSAALNTDGLCDECRGGAQADRSKRCPRCGCLPETCRAIECQGAARA